MPALSLEKFIRRLSRVEREVRTLQTQPRLGNSSIDDGGAITVNDPITGNPQVIIGTQADGTVTVNHTNGPPPPKPSTPTLLGHTGFMIVGWDGRYWTEPSAPGSPPAPEPVTPIDFSRVEVHGHSDPDFEPDPSTTLMGTIESPRGGYLSLAVPYDHDTYIKLVARSLSGKASPASEPAAGRSAQIEHLDIADAALLVTKFNSNLHLIF